MCLCCCVSFTWLRICFLLGPPVPPPSVRVPERSSKVTSSSILFRFNCSWFSDANGAIRYFAVIVAESDGTNTRFKNFMWIHWFHYKNAGFKRLKFYMRFKILQDSSDVIWIFTCCVHVHVQQTQSVLHRTPSGAPLTVRITSDSQWDAAAGAAPPAAFLPRLHQQLVRQSVSDRLLPQPLFTGRRDLRRTGNDETSTLPALQQLKHTFTCSDVNHSGASAWADLLSNFTHSHSNYLQLSVLLISCSSTNISTEKACNAA